MRRDVGAVREAHDARRAAPVEADGAARRQQLGAEAACLRRRPVREVGAREPGGEAEVVLDPRALSRLAAGRLPLDDDRPQALRRAVDRSSEPGRASADDDEVVERKIGPGLEPDALGDRRRVRPDERLAVREEHDGQLRASDRSGLEQARPLVRLHLEPAIRHLAVREQVADALRVLRPAVADDRHALVVGRGPPGALRRSPVGEQVVEHGIEPLLRRMPRLHQVVVDADLVDGADRHLRVRVGRQQHAPRARRDVGALREQLDARHLRHALVGQEQRDGIAALRQPFEQIERAGTGLGREHGEALRVARAKISLDGAHDVAVVVDGEENRLAVGHRLSNSKAVRFALAFLHR